MKKSKAAIQREIDAIETALHQINELSENQLLAIDHMKSENIRLENEEIYQLEINKKNLDAISLFEKELAEKDLLFASRYKSQLLYYRQIVESPLTNEAREIVELMQESDYLGIIVYPIAVNWEPIQRPQHLLMEFARKGYLCFFCDPSPEFCLRKIENGLFVVSKQEHLLQALQTTHVMVLNSYLMQNAWIENLPHKTIWYDVLDRVDFFGLYDRNMLSKHYEVLHEAAIVTYSAKMLKEYVIDRKDAVYLPNAARPEDYGDNQDETNIIPEDLVSILNKRKRIIGYFGAIEAWFDTKLVNELAESPGVEIVLIGHCGISKCVFSDNVHVLGPKPYKELKNYTNHFDALIIPFIVNQLTNSVSPVKFFEYCAIGKPIITTSIAEVIPFAGPGITFVDVKAPMRLTSSSWNMSKEAQNNLKTIASQNQWATRASEIETLLQSKKSCLNIYANRIIERNVAVFTATFMDYNGENYYTGGAERYLVDLYEVCKDLGLKLDIYQYGNFPWHRKYKNIDIYSLGHDGLNMNEFTVETLHAFNRRYLYAVEGTAILNIYSAFFQAYPQVAHPSIGISHGVSWDNYGSQYKDGTQFWVHNERFIKSAEQVQKMISVDTNTSNWFQTVSYQTGKQMISIPNYVDPDEFFPVLKKEDRRKRIVYPRRLYEARGLYITLAVVDEILERFPETEFHFVGKGFEEDVNAIKKAMEKWPNRIFCYHRDPDEMHLVYKEADIVLIPTLYSEGTSLSCLEACATGNTIIATRIGGLTDIIIDRFNGLLINPDSQSLQKAIIECLENKELSETLAKNAYEVSKAFNKKNWKDKWKSNILSMLTEKEGNDSRSGSKLSSQIEIELCVTADTPIEDWIPKIAKYLKQGVTVFVRGEQVAGSESSFGRLQWISNETELYFQPMKKSFD
ncbi:glycosyltransferase [Paenibacillus sinopodophylli]|uniref:glycosyltransferase n=1 Tax=Paenibacillus sinopodophylli TaxID=1837342 RepID=UPI00110CE87A|nr:glycosyltransferase [Paenibacillus sinopodophylli]